MAPLFPSKPPFEVPPPRRPDQPTPSTCLLFPSHLLTARREIFVIRDTYSSIARPKHAFKTARPFKVQRGPQFLTAFILIGWSIAAVVIGSSTEIFS